MRKTLAMIHNSPIRVADDRLCVDRKFHIGMRYYVSQVDARIAIIHPTSAPSGLTIDQVAVSCDELGHEVVTVDVSRVGQPTAVGFKCLRELLAKCDLVCWLGLGCIGLARELSIPYVMVLEYDLRTRTVVTTTAASSPLRNLSRAVKCEVSFACDALAMRQVLSVHCNGNPIHDSAARFIANRLQYLDLLMPASLILPEDQLLSRLQSLQHRTLRLHYSGRHKPMKRAGDAVSLAVDCLRQGMDIEMHCYGRGRLRDEMRRIATQAPVACRRPYLRARCLSVPRVGRPSSRVRLVCVPPRPARFFVHFSRVLRGRSSDRGICQPYVGAHASRVRCRSVVPVHQPHQSAATGRQLIGDVPSLRKMSGPARHFALTHSSEQDFAKRVSSINAVLCEAG